MHLSERITNLIATQFLQHDDEFFAKLSVQYFTRLNRDKRYDVWIHLANKKGVDVEKF